jgi:hypothetical protein
MRRIACGLSIAAGIGLVLLPVVLSLFDRTAAGERLTDGVRPAMTTEVLATVQSAFDGVMAAVAELDEKAIPAFAQGLGQSTDDFRRSVEADYPAVAEGTREDKAIVDRYNPFLQVLRDNRDEFETADTIPIGSLPMTAGAWGSVALGAAFIVLGVVGLRTRSAAALVALLVVGLVAVIGQLAANLPHKVSEADRVVDALGAPFSRRAVAEYGRDLQLAHRFVPELEQRFLPDMARRLQLSDAQLNALIADRFPAIARAKPRLGFFLDTGNLLIGKLTARVDDFQKTEDIPLKTLPWLLIVPGALLAGAAAGALVAGQRPD